MTPYRKRNCPITQRLAEDLMIRNRAETTIDAYTYHVRRFYDFIDKPLATVTPEDVRTFQLHLIQTKNLAYSTFNQAVCALRFYYRHTEPTAWPVTMVPFGKRPKTLPTVLSRSEIGKLFECTTNLKHQTFLYHPSRQTERDVRRSGESSRHIPGRYYSSDSVVVPAAARA
jgi:site-specific recombinase XerD